LPQDWEHIPSDGTRPSSDALDALCSKNDCELCKTEEAAEDACVKKAMLTCASKTGEELRTCMMTECESEIEDAKTCLQTKCADSEGSDSGSSGEDCDDTQCSPCGDGMMQKKDGSCCGVCVAKKLVSVTEMSFGAMSEEQFEQFKPDLEASVAKNLDGVDADKVTLVSKKDKKDAGKDDKEGGDKTKKDGGKGRRLLDEVSGVEALCYVEVESEEQASGVTSKMTSDSFGKALVQDVAKIDDSLKSVSVDVAEYVPPEKPEKPEGKNLFFCTCFMMPFYIY